MSVDDSFAEERFELLVTYRAVNKVGDLPWSFYTINQRLYRDGLGTYYGHGAYHPPKDADDYGHVLVKQMEMHKYKETVSRCFAFNFRPLSEGVPDFYVNGYPFRIVKGEFEELPLFSRLFSGCP